MRTPRLLWRSRWPLLLWPLLGAVLALVATLFMAPTFTARASFIPAPASGMAGLAAPGAPVSPAAARLSPFGPPQYAALLHSRVVLDRLIERFGLREAYSPQRGDELRDTLRRRMRIGAGKRNGLVLVEVDDRYPWRAADLANHTVQALQERLNELARDEALQRSQLLARHLEDTRRKLAQAQQAVSGTGFDEPAWRLEHAMMAGRLAQMQARLRAEQVRLQELLSSVTAQSPPAQAQRVLIGALTQQLRRMEVDGAPGGAASVFPPLYREYKRLESMHAALARQAEAARLDGERGAMLALTVDRARMPELRSGPRSLQIMLATALLLQMALAVRIIWRARLKAPPQARLRRTTAPTQAKPASDNIQVSGSGTAEIV